MRGLCEGTALRACVKPPRRPVSLVGRSQARLSIFFFFLLLFWHLRLPTEGLVGGCETWSAYPGESGGAQSELFLPEMQKAVLGQAGVPFPCLAVDLQRAFPGLRSGS